MTHNQPIDPTIVNSAIRHVARSRRMRPDEADDYAQYVHLKLLERRTGIARQFAGRSSIATYLGVVVNRLGVDWLRSTHGKWRPSAAASRLGPAAVELDRLIHRDGCAVGQAIALVQPQFPGTSPEELSRMAAALSPNHRRRFVGDVDLDARSHAEFEDPVERRERRLAAGATAQALADALSRLSPDDRELLQARVFGRRTIQSVARERRLDPRLLYRRYQSILRRLRTELERAGVTA